MDTTHINSQLHDSPYLVVQDVKRVQQYYVYRGGIYTYIYCYDENDLHERQMASSCILYRSIREKLSDLFCKRKANFVFNKNIKIKRYTDIYYMNYSLFNQNIKLEKLLGRYGLTKEECMALYAYIEHSLFSTPCPINGEMYVDEIIHVRIRSVILFELLFKMNDVILFNFTGLGEHTCVSVMKYILHKFRKSTTKSAVLFMSKYTADVLGVKAKEQSIMQLSIS